MTFGHNPTPTLRWLRRAARPVTKPGNCQAPSSRGFVTGLRPSSTSDARGHPWGGSRHPDVGQAVQSRRWLRRAARPVTKPGHCQAPSSPGFVTGLRPSSTSDARSRPLVEEGRQARHETRPLSGTQLTGFRDRTSSFLNQRRTRSHPPLVEEGRPARHETRPCQAPSSRGFVTGLRPSSTSDAPGATLAG